MKKVITFLSFVVFSLSTYSLQIVLPKAPPSLPLAKASESLPNTTLKYYTDFNTEVIPSIVKEEEGLYVIPTNNAAQLYNKGKNLKLIAILSEGLLSVISNKDFPNIKSLANEEIYIGGQGSSPDVISNYIFDYNKIKVNAQYRTSQEIAKLLITGKVNTAVLPEPLASQVLDKNKSLKRAFILKDEWKKITKQNGIPQVGIFASEKTIKKYSKEITLLSKEYLKSLVWVNSNKNAAAKFGISVFQVNLSEEAFENSIDNMNLVYIEGLKAKSSVGFYLKNVNSIDGEKLDKIPGDDFYKK